MRAHGIQLLVCDVDGTLLNGQKQLTAITRQAVGRLHAAGISVSLVSARPPRGFKPLMEALDIRAACAALNGAIIVDPQLNVIAKYPLLESRVRQITALLQKHTLDAWIYTTQDWYVSNLEAAHVGREVEAVKFSPLLYTRLDEIHDPVVKIVGIGDDYSAMTACEEELRRELGDSLSMSRSLDNRLEITDHAANKGTALDEISSAMKIAHAHIATAGDGENDILMFRKSGFSIAMGQSSAEVRRAASETTSSNANDGLAWAIDHLIL